MRRQTHQIDQYPAPALQTTFSAPCHAVPDIAIVVLEICYISVTNRP
jgi:hypothetical protein